MLINNKLYNKRSGLNIIPMVTVKLGSEGIRNNRMSILSGLLINNIKCHRRLQGRVASCTPPLRAGSRRN